MKILFISRWFPYPPDNGSKIRVFNLIKNLSSHHEVDLISFTSETLTGESLEAMRRYCQHVDVAPYRPFQPNQLKALLGFFSRHPRSVMDTHSIKIQSLVEEASQKRSFDLIVTSQFEMVPYTLTVPDVPRIFEEIELTTLYERFINQRQLLKKLRYGLTWWKLSAYVADLLRTFDGCTVVSKGELERIQQVSANLCPVGIIPNGVDTSYYTVDFDSPEANTLVYTGALTYDANFDAMNFFLREIFPLIRAKCPQVRLFITGKLDGVPVEQLPDNEGVVFTGYLDDIRPMVARSWISVVPLRLGGGTRLKILEALALGTPVVATSKGAEGLDLIPDQDLLIADKPADFATAVVHLLQDTTLRETLSHHGRQTVQGKYDWRIIGQQFNDFIETVVSHNSHVSIVE